MKRLIVVVLVYLFLINTSIKVFATIKELNDCIPTPYEWSVNSLEFVNQNFDLAFNTFYFNPGLNKIGSKLNYLLNLYVYNELMRTTKAFYYKPIIIRDEIVLVKSSYIDSYKKVWDIHYIIVYDEFGFPIYTLQIHPPKTCSCTPGINESKSISKEEIRQSYQTLNLSKDEKYPFNERNIKTNRDSLQRLKNVSFSGHDFKFNYLKNEIKLIHEFKNWANKNIVSSYNIRFTSAGLIKEVEEINNGLFKNQVFSFKYSNEGKIQSIISDNITYTYSYLKPQKGVITHILDSIIISNNGYRRLIK